MILLYTNLGMGSVIECFLLHPTTSYRVTMRRYSRGDDKCPANNWCHNADTFVSVEVHDKAPSCGDSRPHDDLNWPAKCALCDYLFVETDHWQVNYNQIYYRASDGHEYTLTSEDQATVDRAMMAPPGAMWDAYWMGDYGETGEDKKSYVVRTPGGDWHIDGNYNHGRWTRTGVAPNLTVTPSICIGTKKDGGWAYHGFLTGGKLIEC